MTSEGRDEPRQKQLVGAFQLSARASRVAQNPPFSFPPRDMSSATRALAASSLLLCAIACAAVALLTIASSATEQLAQQPHFPVLASSSSISSLEARVEADAKSAAAKDAGVKSLQAELIKCATRTFCLKSPQI